MQHLTTALTTFSLIAACSSFTATSRYENCDATASGGRVTKKSPFSAHNVLSNNKLSIQYRDSSLAYNAGDPGDVSFLNVLFFMSVYSYGIHATIKSHESQNQKNVVEKVVHDVEDIALNIEEFVIKDDKNLFDALPVAEKVVHDVEDITQSVEDFFKVDRNIDKIEVDMESVVETKTDFNEIKKQVSSTADQYPDITDTLKRVASTKESEAEKLRLLNLNSVKEEEVESISSKEETHITPAPENEKKEEISSPKRKDFRNKVKRIAKKIVMPWRKFSDIK